MKFVETITLWQGWFITYLGPDSQPVLRSIRSDYELEVFFYVEVW